MFKTCPRCGDEFLPHVSECPDCRVALQHGAPEGAPAVEEPSGGAEPAMLESAALLRHGEVWELRELAERLQAEGIACAVDTDPPGARIVTGGRLAQRKGSQGRAVRLALYVAERDVAAALAVDQAWTAEGVPDAELAGPVGAISACPGCGEPLAPSAAVCSSCGLEFPEHGVLCSACGQAVAPDAESCPHCGTRA